jgi:hypothetical protein
MLSSYLFFPAFLLLIAILTMRALVLVLEITTWIQPNAPSVPPLFEQVDACAEVHIRMHMPACLPACQRVYLCVGRKGVWA